MNRQETSGILKEIHERASAGGLEPRAVMISRVVVSDRRMEAAAADFKVLALVVGQKVTLNIDAEFVRRVGADDNFRHEAQLVGELRVCHQGQFTRLERAVRISAQREDQGI